MYIRTPRMPGNAQTSPFLGAPRSHFGQAPTPCAAYDAGERVKAAQRGFLHPDVVQHARGLLIADFVIDWGNPRPSVANDPRLKEWLRTMIDRVRADPSTTIRISGFSDCIGAEKNNARLRLARAQSICHLIRQLAGPRWELLRPKIAFVGAATAGEYITDNSTAEGRAQNRSVLIEHRQTVTFEPESVTARDTIQRVCKRGLELARGNADQFGVRMTPHQVRRIRCFMSRLCQSGYDDRYLTGQGVLDYMNRLYAQPYYASAKQWLLPEYLIKSRKQASDEHIWNALSRIDYDIEQGRRTINRYFETHGAATPILIREMRDWIANQEKNERTIYWCYGQDARGP